MSAEHPLAGLLGSEWEWLVRGPNRRAYFLLHASGLYVVLDDYALWSGAPGQEEAPAAMPPGYWQAVANALREAVDEGLTGRARIVAKIEVRAEVWMGMG